MGLYNRYNIVSNGRQDIWRVIAGKLNKLLWRESLAVGVLMSCKGIVEIVVLTVGLNAGIITQRVYSMFIVMTLLPL